MSTKTYAKKLIGVTGGIAVPFRDSVMDRGFVGLFDFGSDYVRNYDPAYVAGAVTGGHSFNNLVDGAAQAAVSDPFAGLSKRGLLISGSGYAQLPDAFKVPTDCAEFMFGMTIWNDPAATYGASEAGYIGGYGQQNGANCVYGFTYAADANGKIASITARSTSSGATSADAVTINAGNPIFLMQHWKKVDATHFDNRLYVNGSQAAAQTNVVFGGALANPSGALPVIGTPTANTALTGYQKALRGAIGRVWLKILANDPASVAAADVAAKAYAKYGPAGSARFVP